MWRVRFGAAASSPLAGFFGEVASSPPLGFLDTLFPFDSFNQSHSVPLLTSRLPLRFNSGVACTIGGHAMRVKVRSKEIEAHARIIAE